MLTRRLRRDGTARVRQVHAVVATAPRSILRAKQLLSCMRAHGVWVGVVRTLRSGKWGRARGCARATAVAAYQPLRPKRKVPRTCLVSDLGSKTRPRPVIAPARARGGEGGIVSLQSAVR